MYTGIADQIQLGFHLNSNAEIGWLTRIDPLHASWFPWSGSVHAHLNAAGFLLDGTLTQNILEKTLPRHVMSRSTETAQEESDDRQHMGKTDPELLRRLQANDNSAWEEVLAEWQGPLYQHLCYSLPTPDNAADVFQETFEALVTAIQRFDGKVALSTFIYSIASRKVADFFRKRKMTSEIPETLASDRLNISSDDIVFRDVLDALQPQYREALLLRYQMGLSVSELAKVLGRSYKATESLLSRSRRQLEADLEKAGFGL